MKSTVLLITNVSIDTSTSPLRNVSIEAITSTEETMYPMPTNLIGPALFTWLPKDVVGHGWPIILLEIEMPPILSL